MIVWPPFDVAITVAFISGTIALIGTLLTFHVARSRLIHDWQKGQAELAEKWRKLAIEESDERQAVETKMEAEIAALRAAREVIADTLAQLEQDHATKIRDLQNDRDDLAAKIQSMQKEHTAERQAWMSERDELARQYAAERAAWTQERKQLKKEIQQLRREVADLKAKTSPLGGGETLRD